MSTHAFPVGAAARLDVRIERGSIQLLPGEDGTMTVELGGPGADDVSVDASAGGVTVRTSGRFLRGGAAVQVRVTVPADTRASLGLASGDMDVRAPLVELQASAASGDIRVASVTDRTTVKTASGDVLVDRLAGQSSLTSGSGDVGVDRLTGSARLATASGDIEVGVLTGDLSCKTASGDIVVRRMEEGHLTFRTASGETSVAIAPGRRVRYDVNAVTGRLHLPDTPPEPAPAGDGAKPLVRIDGRSVSGDTTLRHAAP